MNVLIVLAHPNSDSFNHAIARHAEQALRAAGHDSRLLDLYQQGFTAAMSAAERRAYHTSEPIVDRMVHDHAALLRWADCLVFVYPTWWSSLPAILKGWLERVMVPGVAFVFDHAGRVRRNLTHIRRIIGISTYGSPRSYVWAINDNGRRTLTRALRLTCGWLTRTQWMGFYAIDTASAAQRERFLRKVDRRLRAL